MLLGKFLEDARQEMEQRGIEAEVEGYEGEDAVVVKQEPGATMEILKAKRCGSHPFLPAALFLSSFIMTWRPRAWTISAMSPASKKSLLGHCLSTSPMRTPCSSSRRSRR